MEISVREILKLLLSVQEIDLRLRNIRNDLAYFPAEIGRLEAKKAEIVEVKKKLDKQISKTAAKVKELESELEMSENLVLKLQAQLNSSKTRTEYVGLKNQLESRKQENRKLEKVYVEVMETHEKLQEELGKADGKLEAAAEELEKFRAEIGDREENLRIEMREIEAEREAALAQSPTVEREAYNRIAGNRGEALAPVVKNGNNYNCGVCNCKLPINKVSKVFTLRDIQFCESCSCILYPPEKL